MRWQRLLISVLLFAAWCVFAGWQYRAYRRERDLIHETLEHQANAVMNALLGGIRSHRRLGRYFEVQMQGILDELAASKNVLGAMILSEDGTVILEAGQRRVWQEEQPIPLGDELTPAGYRLVKRVVIQPAGPSPLAGGSGGGFGRGRFGERDDLEGPFAQGGAFRAALLLDRTQFDHLSQRSQRAHSFVTVAAALVGLALGFAWRASMRLVEAEGRARVLETEARHLRELSQAAAGLAHETRNPLSLIRGWTQRLAQEGMEEKERARHAATLLEECDRIAARINQFLAFARPCKPELAEVDVSELVEELAIILQPDLETKGLSLEQQIATPSVMARADPELLRQALFNLIQNAIYFSPEGGRVVVELCESTGKLSQIRVLDRGPGVPEDVEPSLFTPYFTTRQTGTGLGLAIVRRIALTHGWRVAYRSRPGGGSIFSLEGIHG